MNRSSGRWPYYAHLTPVSRNSKTGPIPVSVTNKGTCPPSCKFDGNGCYAEYGPLGLHWSKVDSGERALPWEVFCDVIDTLPALQLWRHNVAGDLPGSNDVIDHAALDLLLQANTGKRGFTYTHYPPNKTNTDAIVMANLRGLTVNLSANSIEEVDDLVDLGIGPVVCVLPANATANVKTPKGRTVVVCPATQRADVNCMNCQLCQRQRDTVVGFPAHGSGTKRIELHLKGATHQVVSGT